MAHLDVETPAGFRFRSTLLSHGWIDLAPFDFDETYTHLFRTHRLQSGRVIRFTVRPGSVGNLIVEHGGDPLDAAEDNELVGAVRRIFSLDLDLASFYESLRDQERYRWVEQHGAGRLLRAPSVWEDLVKTLLTTNTTWAMTRAMVKRLTALGDTLRRSHDDVHCQKAGSAVGDGSACETGSAYHAFPLPEQVAALSIDELDARVRAGYRSGYLHELASKIAHGEIDVEEWSAKDLTADELYDRIKGLSGFGPYAAGAVLKLIGKYDRLALDSAARSMFAREFAGGERVLDSAITTHYEPFGEWRGLVMWMDLMGAYLRDNT